MSALKFTPACGPEEIERAAAQLAREVAIARDLRNWESHRYLRRALFVLVGEKTAGRLIRHAWWSLLEVTIERRSDDPAAAQLLEVHA